MVRVIAYLWQALWGFPQTLLGLMLLVGLRGRRRHYRYRTAIVTEWNLDAGFTSGMFIFVPRVCPQPLLAHEYGHTLQSLMLGPLYLPLIVLPSLMWAGLPRAQRFRSVNQYSYYRFPVERWANLLAMRVTGETPEGWYRRGERAPGPRQKARVTRPSAARVSRTRDSSRETNRRTPR